MRQWLRVGGLVSTVLLASTPLSAAEGSALTRHVQEIMTRPSQLERWLYAIAQVDILPAEQAARLREDLPQHAASSDLPFSFVYGGRQSRDLVGNWQTAVVHGTTDNRKRRHTVTMSDPETGLEVRWEGVAYSDFPVVEWTVHFTNHGTEPTPILAGIRALDTTLQCKSTDAFVLHHTRGTVVAASDYEPFATTLNEGDVRRFTPKGGRPCGGEFPYFNLEVGDKGIIMAVGWPGQWNANFACSNAATLHVDAGQKTTHMALDPGETIRTPLVALLFYRGGDWIDGQNLWRRWMIAHNLPRRGGKPLPLPMFNACSSHQFAEMVKANEKNQIEFIDSYLAKGLQLDYWWMDAGWYVGAEEHGWPHVGTWQVDRRPHRFPNGLRAISDHARQRGVKTIVWFEPERVAAGTWLAENRPQWVLGGAQGGLLNLGNPAAWQWLVARIDKIITQEGIDLYRQDFNMDPLPFWMKADTPNRKGMAENKYVTAYLAYWDELLRRHPNLVIDSCASGGFRNDLETMRRAVPLLRSDYLFEPVGQQGHTYGISFWLPFHGTAYSPSNTTGWGWKTGGVSYGPYTRRSNMCPSNTGCFDFRVAVDDALIKRLYREWLAIGPDYFGDYYPLTKYNRSQQEWLAWEFYRPQAGTGFVQAFRRQDCGIRSAELPLRGLDPKATYVLYDEVHGERTATGQALLDRGLLVEIPTQPGALTIRLVKQSSAPRSKGTTLSVPSSNAAPPPTSR